jgi:hypothetical protein
MTQTIPTFRLDKEDFSCNGSKTQSATTTESNTPENTVKMDVTDIINRFSTQSNHNFTFTETGELITESKLNIFLQIILSVGTNSFSFLPSIFRRFVRK